MKLTGQQQMDEAPLRIHSISLQAFKAFKGKIKIGPLTPFTCIVGPNGTGKSVIGEALAFTLGASATSMRAKASSSIVHQDLRNAGCAKVSVTLERSKNGQKVKVCRAVCGSSSRYYWKDDEAPKREISLTELKQKLAILHVSADNLDRFLVMQNRVSFKVKQAQELTKYLELIIGTSHYKENIKEADEQIAKQSAELESIQQSLSEIQLKRQQLSPEVEKWKMFTEKWQEFSQRKASFLRNQEKALQGKLQIYSDQKEDKSLKLLEIHKKQNSLKESLTKLNLECTQWKTLLQDCQKKQKNTQKQYDALRIKLIKEEVQLKEAEKEVILQKDLHQREQRGLKKRRKDAEKEMHLLCMDVTKLENEKQGLWKEKEEAEEKRSCILSRTSTLQVEDLTVQQESLLAMKIKRLQERLNMSDERKKKHISQASQLAMEIEILEKELKERLEFEEEQERKISAAENRLSQLRKELHLMREEKLPKLKEEISKNEVEIKYLLKKVQDIQNRPDKLSREDEAANILLQQLKGKFHGRITDLATVSTHLVKALNSVLCNLANPATTRFVVDDRDTASSIISYFQKNRIGIVTCEILSELSLQLKFTNTSKSEAFVKPVLQDLQYIDNYQPVFQKYFGNWYVAKDLASVTTYFERKQSYSEIYNIVTEGGDIFKKDGEVIRANQNIKGRTAFKSSHDISNSDEIRTVLVWEEALKQKTKQKDKLETSLTVELNTFELIKHEEREAVKQLCQLNEILKSHSVPHITCIQTKLENQRIEVKTIHQAIEDDSSTDKLQKEILELKEEQMKLKSKLEVLEDIPTCNPELIEVNKRIKQFEETVRLDAIKIRQKRSSIKILNNQLEAMDSCSKHELLLLEKSMALASQREKFLCTKEQTQQAELDNLTRISEIEKMETKVIEIETEIGEYNKEGKNLRSIEVCIKNELNELMALETTAEERLRKVLLALQDSCDPQLHKKVCHESNDLSYLQALPNEAEDEEGSILAQEEMSLNEIRRSIHADALEEDVKYRKNESYLLTQVESFSQIIELQRNQKDNLETERFHIFRESVKKVNSILSNIYRNLTKHGDAYLSFMEEKSLLFSDGVNLQVRPDCKKWRTFNSLSGGQQALASLALSFSLQAMFPSPFYFFDEIDAALDIKNARLVAEYIKSQTSAQYIMVSHRPQLYELATSLVGVYHYNGASTCVPVIL